MTLSFLKELFERKSSQGSSISTITAKPTSSSAAASSMASLQIGFCRERHGALTDAICLRKKASHLPISSVQSECIIYSTCSFIIKKQHNKQEHHNTSVQYGPSFDITMHTVWVRLNAVVFFGLSALLGFSCLAWFSKLGHSWKLKPGMSVGTSPLIVL